MHREVAPYVVALTDLSHRGVLNADMELSIGFALLLDRVPTTQLLAIEKKLGGQLDHSNLLGVHVVLVPHVKDQVVSLVANFNAECLVPHRVKVVVNYRSLRNPCVAKSDVNKGIGHVPLVIKLAHPVLHVWYFPRGDHLDNEVAVEECLPLCQPAHRYGGDVSGPTSAIVVP